MKARARRLKNVDCIIIDYLGLIRSGTKVENRVQEVTEITRGLKLASERDLNIPVICCAQLSRGTEGRGKSHRPQLSDLRESGSIEQDADIVLMLYREEYYKNKKDDPDSDGKAAPTAPVANEVEVIVAEPDTVRQTVDFIWDGSHSVHGRGEKIQMLDKALSAVEKYNMLSPGLRSPATSLRQCQFNSNAALSYENKRAVFAVPDHHMSTMGCAVRRRGATRNMCAPSAKRTLFVLKSCMPMSQHLQNRARRLAKSAGEECAMSSLNR